MRGAERGVVERDALIDGRGIGNGDVIIGMASSGPHSNGYSLIRKVLERDPQALIESQPAAGLLLQPTRIYVKPVLQLLREVPVKGLAHITGGGLTENIPRILHGDVHASIDLGSWRRGPLFEWLARTGGIEPREMLRTFNCGVGMVAVVAADDLARTLKILARQGETAWELGRIAGGAGGVEYV